MSLDDRITDFQPVNAHKATPAELHGDPVSLPTGSALFAGLSTDEQEKAIGAEPARLVREGEADLKDFVSHSDLETDQPNFITQKPVDAL